MYAPHAPLITIPDGCTAAVAQRLARQLERTTTKLATVLDDAEAAAAPNWLRGTTDLDWDNIRRRDRIRDRAHRATDVELAAWAAVPI